MTKRDYIAFAQSLKAARPDSRASDFPFKHAQWLRDVRAVADCFAAKSAGFDRNMFYDTAGATAPLEALK